MSVALAAVEIAVPPAISTVFPSLIVWLDPLSPDSVQDVIVPEPPFAAAVILP